MHIKELECSHYGTGVAVEAGLIPIGHLKNVRNLLHCGEVKTESIRHMYFTIYIRTHVLEILLNLSVEFLNDTSQEGIQLLRSYTTFRTDETFHVSTENNFSSVQVSSLLLNYSIKPHPYSFFHMRIHTFEFVGYKMNIKSSIVSSRRGTKVRLL